MREVLETPRIGRVDMRANLVTAEEWEMEQGGILGGGGGRVGSRGGGPLA